MEKRYLRSLNRSLFILSGLEKVGEEFEQRMVEENRIQTLLTGQIVIADGQIESWHDITGLQPLSLFLGAGRAGGKLLYQLMEGIRKAARQVEDYLLQEDGLFLTKDTIFWEPGGEEIRVIYSLGGGAKPREDLKQLLEEYMQLLNHEDKEGVEMVYDLYRQVCEENGSLQELKIRKKEKSYQPRVVRDPGKRMDMVMEKGDLEEEEKETKGQWREKWKKEVTKGITKKAKEFLPYKSIKRQPEICYDPAAVMEVSHPTVLLGKEIAGKLIYQGDRQERNFTIEKANFLIGKSKEMVDGVLEADSVSRLHARIIKRDENFFLEDLNSSNGTFLNGIRLGIKEQVLLAKNDCIEFAEEAYEFR